MSSKEELRPWVEKIEVKKQTKVLRAYFNNHYGGGAAAINALQFKEILGNKFSKNERSIIEHAQEYPASRQLTLAQHTPVLVNR